MDPAEVEFLAEKESIKIVPNFTLEQIYMIGVSCELCYEFYTEALRRWRPSLPVENGSLF